MLWKCCHSPGCITGRQASADQYRSYKITAAGASSVENRPAIVPIDIHMVFGEQSNEFRQIEGDSASKTRCRFLAIGTGIKESIHDAKPQARVRLGSLKCPLHQAV